MRYQIPQFIEIEDKIFGPLTLKQFLYLAGGGAITFILWSALPNIIAILIIAPVIGISLALAFAKPNGRPFIHTMEYAVKFFLSSKVYIWKKSQKSPEKKEIEIIEEKLEIPKLSNSKLKELTWSLDVNKNIADLEKTESNNFNLQI